MKTYRTAEVASIIGVHPNTVRLYEKLGLIPKPERKPNGYRIFTDFHIEQFKLARLALQVGMALFGPMADKVPLQWIMIGSGIALIALSVFVGIDRKMRKDL